jgi:hypothetical protein
MTDDEKKAITDRLDTWAAKMRMFLGNESYDRDCLPYVGALRASGSQNHAMKFSSAVTMLNSKENYDSDTRAWHNEEAKALWEEGNQIRDAYLGVSLTPKPPISQ